MKSIRFEGKVHQFPDDATDAEISGALEGRPTKISTEDWRAYSGSGQGPEGVKARTEIEGRYGGGEEFRRISEASKRDDPAIAGVVDQVYPLALSAGIMGGVPGLIPAMAEGGAAALASPALRKVAVEVLKWLGKGAAAGVGAGGAYELGRKAMSK